MDTCRRYDYSAEENVLKQKKLQKLEPYTQKHKY